MPGRPRSGQLWLVAGVAGLAIVVSLGAALGPIAAGGSRAADRPAVEHLSHGSNDQQAPHVPQPLHPRQQQQPAASVPKDLNISRLAVVADAIALLVLLVVVVAAVRRWRLRLPVAWTAAPPPTPVAPAEEEERRLIAHGVARAVDALEASGSPRDRIIACWSRVEDAVAAVDHPREETETPGDLVRRVLSRHRVDAELLEQLRDRYEVARFSSRPVAEGELSAARRELRQLVAELDARVAVPS